MAFEYNGPQHYMIIKKFSTDFSTLLKIKRNDLIKMRICKSLGIKLITIPYCIKLDDMYNYIIKQCKTNNIVISSDKEIVNKNIFKNNNCNMRIYNRIQNICKRLNVTCINILCQKSDRILTLKCTRDHIFNKHIKHINDLDKNICNTCMKEDIMYNKIKSIIEKNNGILLSKKSEIMDKFVKIKCQHDKIFIIEYRLLYRGQFCIHS